MAKKSFWNSESKYGTYEGPRGNPEQWSKIFDAAFEGSDTVKTIAMQGTNHHAFSVLGLLPSASEIEIKRTYRTLVKEHHPDKGGDRERFEQIVSAYRIITGLTIQRNPEDDPLTPRRSRTEPHFENSSTSDLTDLIIPQLLTEIEESELERYLFDDAFGVQEKKDGRHLTLQMKSNSFFVRNKKGDVSTCAPEFENSIRVIGKDLLLDGEHIKNKFYAWDLLEYEGEDLRSLSYLDRYNKLVSLNLDSSVVEVVKLVTGSYDKKILFERLRKTGKEGIVFKRLNAKFSEGKGDDQFKFKFYAEASVIVIAGRPGKASIGMEVINSAGIREFVGYCSCSRFPLPAVGSIAEIKYLYAYPGGCLYQPAFKDLRDDVDLNECTTAKLKYKSIEV
jgi:bifunctional non-homologous end joining protein LigD